jgi:hypothetical protein
LAEAAGVPAVGIICTGFIPTARAAAKAEGLPNARLVEYPPPNIGVQNKQDVQSYAKDLLDEVIGALTEEVQALEAASSGEPWSKDIVFTGTLAAVNEFFYEKNWTDGLPIVPPRIEKVQEFLKYTDRSPDEVIGLFPPEKRECTVWTVAVNGVMAGCRPEYMPVLLAITQAIAEPRYSIEKSGSTAGWAPMIIVNGPIINQLKFECETSVTRPGRQANTTIGRYLRLFMVNGPRFLPGITDKATFGLNFFVVLAEAEHRSPWEPLSVSLGFKPGASVVTVNSALSVSYNFMTAGSAEQQLEILAEEAIRAISQEPVLQAFGPERRHMLTLSPLTASILAEGGYSKTDIQQYLFENVRIPAGQFDRLLQRFWPNESACTLVGAGKLPDLYCESDDPNRVVPLMWNPNEFLIIVAGDPERNRSFIAMQCADQGLATSKEIRLPANWEDLLARLDK